MEMSSPLLVCYRRGDAQRNLKDLLGGVPWTIKSYLSPWGSGLRVSCSCCPNPALFLTIISLPPATVLFSVP